MLYLASLDHTTADGLPVYREPATEDAPVDELAQDRVRAAAAAAVVPGFLTILNPEELFVIEGLFGFGPLGCRTLVDLAAEMGIGVDRVRGIRNVAMNRLSIQASLHLPTTYFQAA